METRDLDFLGALLLALAMLGLLWLEQVQPARAEPPSVLERRLDRLEREEERRHGEVLTRVEALRRQVLRLHGRNYVE